MQKPNRPSAAFCVVVCPESSRTDAPGRARAGAEPAPPDLEETKRSPAADRRENGDPRSAWDFRVQSAQETYALVTDEDVDVLPDTPVLALGETRSLPQLYMPVFASRQIPLPPRTDAMTFVVKAEASPAALTASARSAVARVDPKLALAQIRTLQDLLDRSSSQMAFTMTLLAIAAAVALALGLVGIYGVMSYIVSQRTTEIGVRLALGAAPGSVAGMIVRQGGLVAAAGIAFGIIAALAGGRLIESVLYGVSPRDPGVFAFTTTVLLIVATGACWIPARRAARLSPLEALRTE